MNHILEAQKWISSFLDSEKKRIVSNAVIKSHRSYCLLIWIFSSWKLSKLIKKNLQKTCKNSVWWYTESTFYALLQLSKSASVHYQNIQTLSTEGHKIVNEICPPIMKILFSFRKKQIQPQKLQRNDFVAQTLAGVN